MPEIIITVAKDGSTQVTVLGVAGSGCQKLTEALEQALGEVEQREATSEYYQEAQETHLEVQR